ncbi:alpha/beta fold hydrolase [Verrucosispora sp. WMMD573]|uniref:thioesterase II family protein n=1 Tax=Verrucosispora sp. WMMD573 TaxID=3015149 RepID=UPI00248BA5C4|nr:alpha/beta fold hydrolase [Verrucosispora sp. WMMD573]WBB53413.1 alpha/beta fold hydrolase [Verrucosispora sp. WMMD573]
MSRTRRSDRRWVRTLTGVEEPTARLVCFPHSGGTAAVYRPWSSMLPADVALHAVQYPGHADRLAEEPASSIAEMATQVAAELLRMPPAGCALVGHSLGALVAYETARALRANGSPVHHLFVSGAAGPWLAGGGTTHQLGDDELWAAVAKLGGIEPEIADQTELRDLLLPVLRSDITLHETYRPAPDAAPLDCPVRGYYNTEDPLVDADKVAAWAVVNERGFSMRAWPGGHFRLLSHPDELVGDVLASLMESGVPR